MKKSFAAVALAFVAVLPVYAGDHLTDPEKYYLLETDVVDSREFLELPPDTASARYAYDMERYEWGKSMRSTVRGRRAVADADLSEGWLDRGFSEAFGFKLTPQDAPQICKLLSCIKGDAGDLATRSAKRHYMRPRPFMFFNEPSATPRDEPGLSKNGSYPSGHTAIGWATALVLSEINPARALEIMKRGYDFGQSRVICGVHYQSDVDAGRLVGAAVVSRLHASQSFSRQLAKAKREFAKLQKMCRNK